MPRRTSVANAPLRKTKATSALIGYAVLRANFNYRATSYLDNFTGFALDALAIRHPDAATEAEIAEDWGDAGFDAHPDLAARTVHFIRAT